MMRFLGNTLAKVMEGSCLCLFCFVSLLLVASIEIGKEQNIAVLWQGRLQCRDFSSVGGKVVTRSSKVVGYAYKVAFCGIGYVIGGLTTSPVSKQVQDAEEFLVEQLEFFDEQERRRLERLESRRLERLESRMNNI